MTPTSPGNATAVASAKVSGARKGGAKSACANAARSSSGPTRPAAAVPSSAVAADARGLEHGAREVRLEGHRGALLEQRAEDLVAGVRVDASLARRRDRRAGIETETGRVGEQMAHGRAARAGGLVEVEDPLLGGDEDGAGGRELRDRRPPRRARRRAARREHAARRDGGDRRVRRRPVVDRSKRAARDAILPPCSGRSSRPARPSSARWASPGPWSSATASSSPARRRSCPTEPIRPTTRTARRGGASRSSRPRSREAGASLADVVRTRVYLVDAAVFDGFARAHGEAFSEVRPANTTVVVKELLDPRWLVEIEAEAVRS